MWVGFMSSERYGNRELDYIRHPLGRIFAAFSSHVDSPEKNADSGTGLG